MARPVPDVKMPETTISLCGNFAPSSWYCLVRTTRHGSRLKYFHSGRNRVRLLAKNATGAQLARHLPQILAYDLAYVVFAAVTDRTLAPLRGRLLGVRDWRRYRRSGAAGRVAIELPRSRGVRGALGRRAAWREGSSSFAGRA